MLTDEVLPAAFTLPRRLSPSSARARLRDGAVEDQVGLPWLLRVRWGAVASQVAVLMIAKVAFDVELQLGLMTGLVAFVAVSNGVLSVLPRPRGEWLTGGVLVVDIMVLTALLAASGGAANPFTIFFLVHVALGALLLPPRAVWGLVVQTVLSFGALFVVPALPSPQRLMCGDLHGAFSLHLFGMWVAYTMAAGFVGHFLFKVSDAIRTRDRRLAEVAQQNERLASLSSFSANAAHELGTPLATIALAASELRRAVGEGRPRETVMADAELVSAEARRCRTILTGLSSRAGESMGEMPVRTTPARVVTLLRSMLSPGRVQRLEVDYADGAENLALVAPERTLAEVLHNLVRNAFDAHDELDVDAPVVLRVEAREGLLLHVLDRGGGLATDVRARLGQPFITTRASLGGLGLGVYLVNSYATRSGGWLRFLPRDGGGTEAQLYLKADVLEGPHGG